MELTLVRQLRATPLQEFFKEYLKPECASKQQLLYVMNPTKFMACEFLIRYHEHTRGDKAGPITAVCLLGGCMQCKLRCQHA